MRIVNGGIVSVLLALCAAQPAAAQDGVPAAGVFKEGEDIYQLCISAKKDDVERCNWYLMGAYDMLSYFQDIEVADKVVCLPPNSQDTVIREAAVAYWRKSPGSRKFSAVSNLFNAFKAAFPCK